MKSYEIEAALPLIVEINGNKLPRSFYQSLVNEKHEIKEKVTRKNGKEIYKSVGECECAVKGTLIYIKGRVDSVPENAKYLGLAITKDNMFFLFTETSNTMSEPNYKVTEVK